MITSRRSLCPILPVALLIVFGCSGNEKTKDLGESFPASNRRQRSNREFDEKNYAELAFWKRDFSINIYGDK